jgi:TonB family protein
MSDQENIPQAAQSMDSDGLPILTTEDHLSHLLVEPDRGGSLGSLFRSIKELISPPKLPPLHLTSKPVTQAELNIGGDDPLLFAPDDHLRHLLVEPNKGGWWGSLYQSIKELISPPKLPPLELTSKPVKVKDIWGLYGYNKRSWLSSVIIHVSIVTLAFTLAMNKTVQQAVKNTVTLMAPIDIAPYVAKPAQQTGGGGGGDRSPLPASKGRLPKFSTKQFTPPMAVVNNPDPKLIMEPTLVIPLDANIPNVNMAQYGDPLAKIGPASNGPGSGGGIGSGSGGGVGSGKGPGFGPGEGGGFGGGTYRVGNGVTAPTLTFKVEPEYSEEARKAKFMGTVILYIEVNEKGLVQNPRVLRSVGMGLDEKAIEAVMKWRFRAGYKDGKPVTVAAQVEVNFRLL